MVAIIIVVVVISPLLVIIIDDMQWLLMMLVSLLSCLLACVRQVVGFEGHWSLTRKYPIDMAAFSVGVGFLLQHPSVSFSTSWQAGHLETRFLESLNITLDMLTPQPDANCSQVMVEGRGRGDLGMTSEARCPARRMLVNARQ